MGLKQFISREATVKKHTFEEQPFPQVIEQCYCPNGHRILSEEHLYSGHPGILLLLRSADRQGLLSLSPVIGDPDRTFHDFSQTAGEIVEICCPLCVQPFPIYNECGCHAHLIALFTSKKNDYSDCIGICQRLGCLNAEIISGRELQLLDRAKYF